MIKTRGGHPSKGVWVKNVIFPEHHQKLAIPVQRTYAEVSLLPLWWFPSGSLAQPPTLVLCGLIFFHGQSSNK